MGEAPAGDLVLPTTSVSPDEWVITMHGIGKRFGNVVALDSLDLCVPRYAVCGFIGSNGAGKSTAIKVLLGLSRPTSGSGAIFGHDIMRESVAIRRRVGYMAQDSRFYPWMTAREVLHFTAHFFYAGPRTAINHRVESVLDVVGLSAKADRVIAGFSGGERQRLGIAQAQINDPELLILDEPAAALDPQGRRDVLDIMLRLRGRTTIFYSTHLLDDVQRVSDMVVMVKNGRAVRQGTLANVLQDGKLVYELRLRGNSAAAHARVMAQSWVSHIDVSAGSEAEVIWRVAVLDQAIAQEDLLSLVNADNNLHVLAFGRTHQGLEDAFLAIMGEQ